MACFPSADFRNAFDYVTYEGEGFANSSITLRFQKDVEFEVPNTGGIRSIDVVIKHPRASKGDMTGRETEPGLEKPGESALEVMPDAGPRTPE